MNDQTTIASPGRDDDDPAEGAQPPDIPPPSEGRATRRSPSERLFNSATWRYFWQPLITAGLVVVGVWAYSQYFIKETEYRDKLFAAAAAARIDVVRASHTAIRKETMTLLKSEADIEAMIARRARGLTTPQEELAADSYTTVLTSLRDLELELRYLEKLEIDLAEAADVAEFKTFRNDAQQMIRAVHRCLIQHPSDAKAICAATRQRSFGPRDSDQCGLKLSTLLDLNHALLRLMPRRSDAPGRYLVLDRRTCPADAP